MHKPPGLGFFFRNGTARIRKVPTKYLPKRAREQAERRRSRSFRVSAHSFRVGFMNLMSLISPLVIFLVMALTFARAGARAL